MKQSKIAELPQEIMSLADLKPHPKNANGHPQDQIDKIRRDATVEGIQRVFGGGIEDRGEQNRATDRANDRSGQLNFEWLAGGSKTLPQDPSQRDTNTLYKTPSGRYVRWDGKGILPVD